MDVIRHNHIPPDRDVELVARATRIFFKSVVSTFERWDLGALPGAESHEENRSVIRLKDPV